MAQQQEPRETARGNRPVLRPQESIVQTIERIYGAKTRVMLHEGAGESGPLLPASRGEDTLQDDSQYQILGQIAKGGVGIVYKARDKNLGREVALKVLRSDRLQVKNVAERLIEEAQVGSQLAHPGVVPIYGLGLQKDGRPQFAMKLVKGHTLAELLQERKDPTQNLGVFLDHFEQLCQAMAYCHARGVIHRDLKPANVMVGSFGEVLVVDWGFGKVLGLDHRGRTKAAEEDAQGPVSIIATLRSDDSATQSLAGSIMGTPAYMPPEQALGQIDDLDERADVFALGAVLCEILTGAPPYLGSASDVLVMAAQGRLEEAHERLDQCKADAALKTLAKDCLASVRNDRPSDAGAVAKRLRDHFSGLEERARRAKLAAAKAHAAAQELRAQHAAEKLAAEQEKAKASEERIKREQAAAAAEEQRRLIQWERQRQRRALLLAGSILLAVLVGGVAFLVVSSGSEARLREKEASISRSIREAMDLAGSRRWSAAATAARGSLSLLPADDLDRRAFLEDRIREWRKFDDDEKAAAEQTRKDREVTVRLTELRTRTAAEHDPIATDAAYAAAYRDYGIDMVNPDAAAAAILASPLRAELSSALDDWADLRRYSNELSDRNWRKLLEIAQKADPDPVRTMIRTEHARDGLSALARLAGSADIESYPPPTLVRLARALGRLSDAAGAVRILRLAHNLYADDVWVNLDLAQALQTMTPPRDAEAVQYVRAALALLPDSDSLRWVLTATCARAGQWHGVAAMLRELRRASPDDPAVLAGLADSLSRLGDVEGAQQAAERLVSRTPESETSWELLLTVLAARADAGKLLARTDEAAQRLPGNPAVRAYRAFALERLGRHAEAETAIREALDEFPEDPVVTPIGAALMLERGRPSEAVKLLQPLVSGGMFASPVPIEKAFVEALVATGQIHENAVTLSNRVNSDATDVGAMYGVAAIMDLQWNFAHEEHMWRQILRLTPYDAAAYAGYGELLRDRLGRPREAVELFRRAIELRPETGGLHAGLGLALARTGEHDEARREARRAIELEPFDFAVRADHVRVLLLAGRADEARQVARQAAAEAPEHCAALLGAGTALLHVGDLDGAEAKLAAALALAPESGAVQVALARTRYRKADLDGALGVLDDALEQRASDAEAALLLARVRDARGEEEAALSAYRRVQQLAKSHAAGYAGEAWVRGRSSVAELRDVAEVRRLAQHAVGLTPGDPLTWRSQALALLLAGDHYAAANAAARGLEREAEPGTAAELHFLAAMAHAGRTRMEEAKREHAAGLARLREADGPGREREALRAEAEAALAKEGK